MRKLLASLALLSTAAPACGDAETSREATAKPQRFVAEVAPVNDSGVRGTATMALAANHLTVDIDARGLEPNRIHEQHIQGLVVADEEAMCPSPEEDENGDGRVALGEGQSTFGRSIRALEPFPTIGEDGRLDYELTLTVDPEALRPLENRVVVLRGRAADVDGEGGAEYRPDLPVACGKLRSLEAEGA